MIEAVVLCSHSRTLLALALSNACFVFIRTQQFSIFLFSARKDDVIRSHRMRVRHCQIQDHRNVKFNIFLAGNKIIHSLMLCRIKSQIDVDRLV